MKWILNDLSLTDQFDDVDDFVKKITSFLRVKSDNKLLDKRLSCSREIGNIKIFNELTFSHVVMKLVPHDVKSQILSWASKNGPFWSDDRASNESDYFEYDSIDVTNKGLGECARRVCSNMQVYSFSFAGQYSKSPLHVQHGLKEEPLGVVAVLNIWELSDLKAAAEQAIPEPSCWSDALNMLPDLFPSILLSELVHAQMAPVPYSAGNFKSICERFRVLTEYLDSRDAKGIHTKNTESILNDYFRGDKAWFSNESGRNKIDFKTCLTFKDLKDGENKLFSFHGKIKTPQLRIHIEWPVPQDANQIQVVYIGPKLTKR